MNDIDEEEDSFSDGRNALYKFYKINYFSGY